METLTIRPSLSKILLFIVAFVAVGCAGIWMVEYFGVKTDLEQRVTCWGVIIATVGLPISILLFIPFLFYFRLRPTGLQMRFFFRRTSYINWRFFELIGRWDEISLGGIRREHLAFAFKFSPLTPDKPAPKPTPIMARTRQRTGGLYDLTIPVVVGIDTDKLVALLNEWRIRYGT